MSKQEKIFRTLVVVAVLIVALAIGGWVANVVKLCQCDFDTPLKAEVIRGVGIVVVPVGIIAGYCTIEDGKEKK